MHTPATATGALRKSSSRKSREPVKALDQLFKALRSRQKGLSAADQLALAGAASLAANSLLPDSLEDTPLAGFIVELCHLLRAATRPAIRPDKTEYGAAASAWLRRQARSEKLLAISASEYSWLAELFANSSDSIDFSDPMTTGWSQQCLSQPAREKEGKEHRARPTVDDIASLTQWFTPLWISEFLCHEALCPAIADQANIAPIPVTILDPACGAGHLLVAAVDALLVGQPESPEEFFAELYGKRLFGLDIDSLLLDLTAFALYLKARQHLPVCELPRPHLYSVTARVAPLKEAADGIGSLHLAAACPREQLQATAIDGRVRPLGECLPAEFDAIVANPPYLSHRLIPHQVSAFIKRHYHGAHYDLYAAFLQMSLALLSERGRLAMICQQSVLSIQRYERLRKLIFQRCRLDSVVQLGAGSFLARAGEKVNNAIICLSREGAGREAPTRVWRILDRRSKEEASLKGISAMPSRSLAPQLSRTLVEEIDGAPLALWAPQAILDLFKRLPAMESAATGIKLTNGLFTCNNKKFVKACWQVADHEEARYVPYDKGGGDKWFSLTPYRLDWNGGG
ncbi:MAG TPA: N-6 DNA methylase, partial [Chroococcales cyanobacterium]